MTAVIYFSFFPLMCGAWCEVILMGWGRERRGMAKMGFVACAAASRCFCAGGYVLCATVLRHCGLWVVGSRCDNTRVRNAAATTARGSP